MGNSAQHWNGDVLCAIDVETTGLEHWFHEIIQICILPLDSFIVPRKDVLPFNIFILPENPERMNQHVQKMHRNLLPNIERFGIDTEKAKDLLVDWVEKKLNLPFTKYGTRKKIIPLGQNYAFDKGFLVRWLGVEMYDEYFDRRHRDTMVAANFLNDLADQKAEEIPFRKQGLKYMCNKLHVSLTNHHDALADCIATAEVYKKMLRITRY